MIQPRLEFRNDAEIGANERGSHFCDKFFLRSVTAILRVAAEIAADATRIRRPMNVFMAQHRHV